MTQSTTAVNRTAQKAAASQLIDFAEHVSGSRKYMFVCTTDGTLLATNQQAKEAIFKGEDIPEEMNIKEMLDEKQSHDFDRNVRLLRSRKNLSGFFQPKVKILDTNLLYFKSSLVHQDGFELLYIAVRAASAEVMPAGDMFATESSYRTIFEESTEPLFILDKKGLFIDMNKETAGLIQVEKQQLVGKSVFEAFDLNPSERIAFRKRILQACEGKTQRFDWWFKSSDGTHFPLWLSFRCGKYFGQDVILGTAKPMEDSRGTSEGGRQRQEQQEFMAKLLPLLNNLKTADDILTRVLHELVSHPNICGGGVFVFQPSTRLVQLISCKGDQTSLLKDKSVLALNPDFLSQLENKNKNRSLLSISRNFQHLFNKREVLAMPISTDKQYLATIILLIDDAMNMTTSLTEFINHLGFEVSSYLSRFELRQELHYSEGKYKTLFESSNDSIFLLNHTQIADCNFQATVLLDCDKQNIIGKRLADFSPGLQADHSSSVEKSLHLIESTLHDGQPRSLEWRIEKSDGTILDSEISFSAIMLEGVSFVQCIVRDITSRKEAQALIRRQEVLRESMHQFRSFLSQVNLAYVSMDLDLRVVYVNDYFLQYTGYKREEVIGQNYYELFVPEKERATRIQEIRKALQNQTLRSYYEWDLITKSQSVKILRWNIMFEMDVEGKVVGITAVGKDMTDKRIAMEALKDNKIRLQDLFDNAHDLIQNISTDNKFIFVNRAWKEKLGYNDFDIENLTLNDIVHPYYKAKLIYQLRNLYKGEDVNKIETVFLTKSGKPIHLIGSINCSWQDGKPIATRAILHDITDRIKAERLQKVYYSIANLAISSKDLPSLYSAIHRELSKIIETHNFYIALFDEEKDLINFVYYVDQLSNVPAAPRPFSLGMTEYIIKTGKPLYASKADFMELVNNGKIEVNGVVPEVMLSSPLSIGERIIGVIAVRDYKNPEAYVQTDIEILHFISNQVALAIERKRNEEQINIQNARLKAIFESGTHLMWSINRQYQLTSYNQNFSSEIQSWSGNAPAVGNKLSQVVSSIVSQEYFRLIKEAYERAFTGQPQQFEVELHHPNGTNFWREVLLNPIYLEDGSFEDVSAIALDITEKKISQLSLAVNEEKFRQIFESFQDLYYKTDMQGQFQLISPSMQEVLGYTPDEAMRMNANELYAHPGDRDELLRMLFEQKSVRNFETALLTPQKQEIEVLINSRLILNADQEPVAIEGVCRDITELKDTQRELIRAKEVAENSLQVKNQFLANMSHELRTPMNGIIGMIDVLHHTANNEEQMDYIDTLRKSSDALLEILNDILDLSKIQAGKLQLNLGGIDLYNSLERIHALFANRAVQKDLTFTFDISEDTPRYIVTDETRLLQVLSNLTSNAIKFTNEGSVRVEVSRVSGEGEAHKLIFRVKDSGIGISEEDIQLLFTNFTQLDNSSSKTFGGTGLGLAISKQLSELLGGEIGVESQAGKGSTFWFTIKCQEAENINQIHEQLQLSKELEEVGTFDPEPVLLLVDDNQINQKVALKLLERMGCHADVASNGYEAIEKATNKTYDLIFMDIQMPEMDGVTATHELKKLLGVDCPPIVAMTAYSMKDDAEKFLNKGLDDYISKPVKIADLHDRIMKWLGNGVPAETQPDENISDLNTVPESADFALDMSVVEQLRSIGGDEFALQLYVDFEEETSELLEEAKKEVDAQHYESILSTLHQIKGTASTLGLDSVSTLAQELEHDIKKGKFTFVDTTFSDLESSFTNFRANYRNKILSN
ncbi:PAS domain S-box protein [Rufibacter latericius]|uniref:histidine kinase n=1 Tax=Rufibacter latericius TaxID=2487040 RepID=A0A3M9MU71_9BACT|nr:PAS domain S-box protein [Rufibacter latericius]RNI29072.1 PAS domain S-box protein [Rufibacter latericius]